MEWVIGGFIVIFGIALILAGAHGTPQQLFSGITGTSAKKTPTTQNNTTAAIDAAFASAYQQGATSSAPAPATVTL